MQIKSLFASNVNAHSASNYRTLNLLETRHYKHIQLFRERLSENVYETLRKVIVGGFEFTVLQRNLQDCKRGKKKATIEDSTTTMSGTAY